LSPDGTRLFVTNTPDDRLEIFSVAAGGLTHVGSVPVGLEPVAVAARTDGEVWVVNHLSDSVSIVDVAADPPRVVRTLLVGDEPRDIVFAGRGRRRFTRAFITTARRGQNLPASVPPSLSTPGIPRALVWVFAARRCRGRRARGDRGAVRRHAARARGDARRAHGLRRGLPLRQRDHQHQRGRGLQRRRVRGTVRRRRRHVPGRPPGGQMPGGLPAPNVNFQGDPGSGDRPDRAPRSGQRPVARPRGPQLDERVRFDLPDRDVFAIDALANPPVEAAAYPHVGTVLFNMAVDPASGALLVSNTEAHNEVRFEGPGTSATTVRGDLHQARITVIDDGGVRPRHLNKAHHRAARRLSHRADAGGRQGREPRHAALARRCRTPARSTVAAFGSSAVGRFAVQAVRDDTFTPAAASQIAVSGGGPCGLALDAAGARLYVLTRFDNAVKVIDTGAGSEIAQHPLHNPSRDGARRPADSLRRALHLEQRRGVVRELPRLRRLRQPRLGPRQPRRHRAAEPNPFGPIGGGQPFHPMKGR
jgi:streptogramin lyase